ncbi:GntR family transcriptional regulator [Paenibacillus glycanilyticus]|uniref:GntR family transcriptional regulator n=1 Tax=Paenibacillus glycanilyticus TaxID=126569 RepID=UPI00203F82C7|nr:GntR family transcriptional regulator [Paenibacillus glycanilyticus]MCM3630768.1 GntR family transcriptional regulator [Paenibacillus glycanilyticus]
MWLPIHINEQSAEPLYYQIEVQLRALIVSGQLEEGTLLPSIRELAQLLKCSVITVRRVYQDLETEGLLRTKQGTGTYVARIGQNAMDRYRLDAVMDSLEAAVDAGKLVQCTREELTKLFQEVLDRKFGG